MRVPTRIRGFIAALGLACVLATPALADWSEQGVALGTLSHPFSYDRATLMHDTGGAFFVWLPYCFGPQLLHLDAEQTNAWLFGSPLSGVSTACAWGPAVALDGSGGLFVLEASPSTRLHHVQSSGSQDWGDPANGLWLYEGSLGVDLVADGSGGAWGAWNAAGGVRLQHWLAGGVVAPGWGPAGRLFPGGMLPALASDGTGGVLLFFGTTSDHHAHVTRVQADTTIAPGWTAAGLVLGDFSVEAIFGFHVVLLPSGGERWIAIWPRSGNPTCKSAWARRFHSDGTLDPAWSGGAPLPLVTRVEDDSYPGSMGTRTPPATFSDGAGGFHHVWADTATGMPRWLHVGASGYAPGFGSNGISPLRTGDALASYGNFVAAPSDNGGLVFAWDDVAAGRAPGVRLRWLMPDGTDDPAAPDTGRVIPGTDSLSHVWGLDADGLGGVFPLWSTQGPYSGDKTFLMNHMGRAPYAADVPPPARVPALTLAAPRPTPTRGALDVRCTLAGRAPATLTLFDVNGRRLREVTLQGAGDHVARLDPRGDLPTGVYLLRLTQGRESCTTRAVVLR